MSKKIEARNFNSDSKEQIEYKGATITAYRNIWEEYDEKKNKWNPKKQFVCGLYREWKEFKNLNLGECSDGTPFTAVSQSINEAKWLVDYDIELQLNNELREMGFNNEDFFKYNTLKIWDRISAKENLKREATDKLKQCQTHLEKIETITNLRKA